MKRNSRFAPATWFAAAIVIALAAMAGSPVTGQTSSPTASAPGDAALGKRHVNIQHGFSIRPPAGVDEQKETSPTRLISWLRRDAKTNAIQYTMSIQTVEGIDAGNDLKAYTKTLSDKLTRDEGLTVASAEVVTVAGAGAIDLRGQPSGTKLWQRQVWVQVKPKQFLVFVIVGPPDAKDSLAGVLQGSLETLRLTDPETIKAQREKNLQAGKALLDGLKDKSLADIPAGSQWFILRSGDKVVGFILQKVAPAKRDNRDGLEAKVWAYVTPGKVGRQNMFVSLDRTREQWLEEVEFGAEKAADEGSLADGMLTAKLTGGKPKQQKLPAEPYLPRACGVVLYHLLDLGKASSYAFLEYSTDRDRFNTRTVTIAGPDAIEIAGKKVECIRGTDQSSVEGEGSTIYLDAKGNLLRLKSEDGAVMDQATEDEVVKAFPKAAQIVAK